MDTQFFSDARTYAISRARWDVDQLENELAAFCEAASTGDAITRLLTSLGERAMMNERLRGIIKNDILVKLEDRDLSDADVTAYLEQRRDGFIGDLTGMGRGYVPAPWKHISSNAMGNLAASAQATAVSHAIVLLSALINDLRN